MCVCDIGPLRMEKTVASFGTAIVCDVGVRFDLEKTVASVGTAIVCDVGVRFDWKKQ